MSAPKRDAALVLLTLNEVEGLNTLWDRIPVHAFAECFAVDGGSTDGSTDHEKLKSLGVNTLLTKTGPGKLGAQMRMAFGWALDRGYAEAWLWRAEAREAPQLALAEVAFLNAPHQCVAQVGLRARRQQL